MVPSRYLASEMAEGSSSALVWTSDQRQLVGGGFIQPCPVRFSTSWKATNTVLFFAVVAIISCCTPRPVVLAMDAAAVEDALKTTEAPMLRQSRRGPTAGKLRQPDRSRRCPTGSAREVEVRSRIPWQREKVRKEETKKKKKDIEVGIGLAIEGLRSKSSTRTVLHRRRHRCRLRFLAP